MIVDGPRVAGPYNANGVQTVFAFSFKVMDDEHIVVVLRDGIDDTIAEITTEYTVTLNGDQDVSPGGSITMIDAPDSGLQVIISSDTPLDQPAVFTNTGGFFPRVLNDALDRLTIFAQEQAYRQDRALVVPIGEIAPEIASLADMEDGQLLGYDAANHRLVPVDNPTTTAAAILAVAEALGIYGPVSLEADQLSFSENDRYRMDIVLRRYNEDANTSFVRFGNFARTSLTGGVLFWNQRNDKYDNSEQALRLVCADLTWNLSNKTAVLGTTRVVAEDPDWDIGDPPGGFLGRGKEMGPVAHTIQSGHASNVGSQIVLWNHLVSADGTDDGVPYTLDVHYAVSATGFPAPPVPEVMMTSAQAYAHVGGIVPSGAGAAWSSGNNIIQLPITSQWPGRLVANLMVIRANANWTALLVYTDNIDDGWTFGGFVTAVDTRTHTEASLAYDPINDDIVVISRTEDVAQGLGCGVYRSVDGGATLTYEGFESTIAFSNSNRGFLQTVQGSTTRSRLLSASTMSPVFYQRDDFGIFISYGGIPATGLYRPFPEKFNIGYCQLFRIDNTHVGLIHEDFSGIGQINIRDNLRLSIFSMAEIILGAEAL